MRVRLSESACLLAPVTTIYVHTPGYTSAGFPRMSVLVQNASNEKGLEYVFKYVLEYWSNLAGHKGIYDCNTVFFCGNFLTSSVFPTDPVLMKRNYLDIVTAFYYYVVSRTNASADVKNALLRHIDPNHIHDIWIRAEKYALSVAAQSDILATYVCRILPQSRRA